MACQEMKGSEGRGWENLNIYWMLLICLSSTVLNVLYIFYPNKYMEQKLLLPHTTMTVNCSPNIHICCTVAQLDLTLCYLMDASRTWEPQGQLPCPSLSWVYPNSCSLSQWYHPTVSSSVSHFSSCPQSFPTSGSFPMRTPWTVWNIHIYLYSI